MTGLKPAQLAALLMQIAGFPVKIPTGGRVLTSTASRPITALSDIDLTVARGAAVALRGPSRSGKSTLLRILSGVLAPTSGRAELSGTVASLLRVSDLGERGRSALDVIDDYQRAGSIRTAFPREFADRVIRFAGLEGFENASVERFSSGMQMRLAVALAVEEDPDILLIDDVFRVGDIAFRQKCFERLVALREQGCAILFASADERFTRKVATRVVTFEDGRITADGLPGAVLKADPTAPLRQWQVRFDRVESDVAALAGVDVEDAGSPGDHAVLGLDFDVIAAPQRFRPVVDVVQDGVTVFRTVAPSYRDVARPGRLRCTVALPVDRLGGGDYWIEPALVSVVGGAQHALKAPGAVRLRVRADEAKALVHPVSGAFDWSFAVERVGIASA